MTQVAEDEDPPGGIGARLREEAWGAIANGVGGSFLLPTTVRRMVYRLMGVRLGPHAGISPGTILRSRRLVLGRASSVNYRCVFDNRGVVVIGDRVGIGVACLFITSHHEFDDPACRAGQGRLRPIRVGDGAWIGSNVTVLGGVTIGPGAVVAAGAVVTRDCLPHHLYGGVPAKIIRAL